MNQLIKLSSISLILSGLMLVVGCEDKKAEEEHQITVSLKMMQNDVEVTTLALNVETEFIFEVTEIDGHDDHGTHINGLTPHMEIGGHEGAGIDVEIHTGTEDGHYEGHYTFTETGTYEIHFSFTYEGMEMEEHFEVTCQ